ncbi:hypothetical protein [Nisaea sediminum]|uniref:hypothetical protein n=1 Tax=Nisaea sediminum TaxID=2775867 RepID=UPI001866EFEF|nr:hypothetical protein [Nisaea sediminum]
MPEGERGTAMLLALVLLALASGLLLGLTGLGRSAVGTAGTAIARSENAILLESAIQAVIPDLFDEEAAEMSGRAAAVRPVRVGEEIVELRIADICSRWDVNRGNLDVFVELLAGVGADAVRVASVVDLLREARLAREPFLDVSQLLALPGLNATERAELAKVVTVHCRAEFVDTRHAAPELAAAVRRAERISGMVIDGRGGGRTWHLAGERETGPGTLVAISAVVALSHDIRHPVRILEWRSSE